MKNVVVTLHKKEIMSDVVNVAYVTGRRLFVTGQEEKASDIQTPEESPDKYIIARAMASGYANVRGRCARYLTSGRLEDNNSLEDVDGDYVLTLSMPERWNLGVTVLLTSTMHDYMVDYCVYRIFEKTNPEESSNYARKADLEFSRIKSILEMRTAPIRRPANRLY